MTTTCVSVVVTMRDGSVRNFPPLQRFGGYFTKQVRYETSFVVITDEYGDTTAIPVELIDTVLTQSEVQQRP
jgi:hypothetical protein